MNANLDLERRLADHYASEAPQRAPDRVLIGALAVIDTTRQRHVLVRVPWRFPTMNSYAKFAIAAVAVVAFGAVGLAVLGPGPDSGPGVVTPTVSPLTGPSQSPPAAGIRGTAANFVRPFDYVLPSNPQFDNAADEERYFEVRVPEWYEAGHMGGLIIQAVGGGLSDPCDATSAVVPLEPGADAVFAYLATIPQLTITDLPDTTVGGRPARQATVTSPEGPAACPELYTWSDATESFITGGELRLIAAEVDGENVVVSIFGETGNPEWPAMADEFLASMRFEP